MIVPTCFVRRRFVLCAPSFVSLLPTAFYLHCCVCFRTTGAGAGIENGFEILVGIGFYLDADVKYRQKYRQISQ